MCIRDSALTVHLDDALTADEGALAAGRPTAIVSNLPYNVGTPLLIKWLTGRFQPTSLTLMFQKEVAERIVAEPGSDAYGRLAVIAQATSVAKLVMEVSPRAFTPPPKVTSAVVHIVPHAGRLEQPLLDRLQTLTAAAWSGLYCAGT